MSQPLPYLPNLQPKMSLARTPVEATSQPGGTDVIVKKSLLDLPGEIRNRIYDYVADVDTFKIFNTKPALEIQLDERSASFFPIETNLPYIPLAHVCRTLRAEFLPMFMARTALSIRYDDIHGLIDCFVFPPTMDVEKVIGQVVFEQKQQWTGRSIDVKPLLLLSEAAKGISFVFKHVTIKGDVYHNVRDYTLQELLGALLGVNCSSFASYARETVCSMMLDLASYESVHGRVIWVKNLEITLPERQYKPWMAYWNSDLPAVEIVDHIRDNENRGIGEGPPFTMYWCPDRGVTKFRKLVRWPWVERLAQPAQSRDSDDV